MQTSSSHSCCTNAHQIFASPSAPNCAKHCLIHDNQKDSHGKTDSLAWMKLINTLYPTSDTIFSSPNFRNLSSSSSWLQVIHQLEENDSRNLFIQRPYFYFVSLFTISHVHNRDSKQARQFRLILIWFFRFDFRIQVLLHAMQVFRWRVCHGNKEMIDRV